MAGISDARPGGGRRYWQSLRKEEMKREVRELQP
jgi:hypothetical protein